MRITGNIPNIHKSQGKINLLWDFICIFAGRKLRLHRLVVLAVNKHFNLIKKMKQLTLTIISALLSLGMAQAQNTEEMATFRTWAMTPPMGWNSWDCYYSSVTEKEVLQNAQYLVDNDLVKYGWEYVVVDIR